MSDQWQIESPWVVEDGSPGVMHVTVSQRPADHKGIPPESYVPIQPEVELERKRIQLPLHDIEPLPWPREVVIDRTDPVRQQQVRDLLKIGHGGLTAEQIAFSARAGKWEGP